MTEHRFLRGVSAPPTRRRATSCASWRARGAVRGVSCVANRALARVERTYEKRSGYCESRAATDDDIEAVGAIVKVVTLVLDPRLKNLPFPKQPVLTEVFRLQEREACCERT